MRFIGFGLLLALAVVPWDPQPSSPAPAAPPKPFDCSASVHRQFDFWLGDWDVVTNPATAPPPAAGASSAPQKPGHNVITLLDGGCALMESWTATAQTGH